MFTVFAVAFAALAGLLIFAVLQTERSESDVVETVPVVVAAQEIPPRTKITAAMLRIRDVPAEVAIERGFNDPRSLVGLIARYPIAANEQISVQKVGATESGDSNEQDGLSFVVPAGKRAVGITVTEQSAVGGLIIAGDRVDVIALFSENMAGDEKAVTILQDVEVLSVAQVAQEHVPPAVSLEGADEEDEEDAARVERLGVRPIDPEPQPQARTVTLAVSPEDAQILALADQNSVLWLTLRAFDDNETVALREATLIPLGVLPAVLRR